jgi:hypothetical protein
VEKTAQVRTSPQTEPSPFFQSIIGVTLSVRRFVLLSA